MAYNKKNVVEYFPHAVNHGRKMFIIRSEFGNDGYAVWFMLLEQLGKADNHFLNLKDRTQILYLLAEFQVDETLFNSLVNRLVELGEFDKRLWLEAGVIYSQKFTQSVEHAYERRVNKCLPYYEICKQFLENCDNIAKPEDGFTHSIVNDSKVNTIAQLEFEKFWDMYGKKVDRKKCLTKWKYLTKKDIRKIFEKLPGYIKATPEIQYRKNPLTYLNGESWNDELATKPGQRKQVFN